MKIELRAEKKVDDATAKADTGKTLSEWFKVLDSFGGPAKGRREIGSHLNDTYKLDPWWSTTLNIEYEAAHKLIEKDGKPKGYMICATKTIKATPEQCYAAFASASALDAWLGPKNKLDMKEGGLLENADGNRATIRKFNPGKTIRMTWQQADAATDTPVEVKFQPSGAKTTVMVMHDRLQGREQADGLRRAWGGALDALKAVLEK
ncbi:MAG: hypothetical protein A3E01_19500 [Gammaproteobacteria bacterium RIFCSPHIGHO2_12_FULL_63_22]|nr:MAG: hypothetical protein A3E01_19500 [Gammaproteobacteria bacterium RIFCSPHIGHO2_12_FULL_63_22]